MPDKFSDEFYSEFNVRRRAFIKKVPSELRAELRTLIRDVFFDGYKKGEKQEREHPMFPEDRQRLMELAKEQLKFMEENWPAKESEVEIEKTEDWGN